MQCQYAFDKNDDFCKNCDGINVMVDGVSYPADQCQGYVEDTADMEIDGSLAKDFINEPVEETAQDEEQAVAETVVEESTQNVSEDATNDPVESDDTSSEAEVVETVSEAEEFTLPDGVTVKAMRYMSGMTICHKDTYYKFSAEEEWALDDNVGSDSEKVESIREKLWAKLNLEVDNQVSEILKM